MDRRAFLTLGGVAAGAVAAEAVATASALEAGQPPGVPSQLVRQLSFGDNPETYDALRALIVERSRSILATLNLAEPSEPDGWCVRHFIPFRFGFHRSLLGLSWPAVRPYFQTLFGDMERDLRQRLNSEAPERRAGWRVTCVPFLFVNDVVVDVRAEITVWEPFFRLQGPDFRTLRMA